MAIEFSPNNKIILAITEQDVIDMCLARTSEGDTDFEWTEEEVRSRMRSFEKGLQWGAMDVVWEALRDVANDIEDSA